LLKPFAMRAPAAVRLTPPVALILDGHRDAAVLGERALRLTGYDVVHTLGLTSARDILEHRRIDLLVVGLRPVRRRVETTLVVSRRPALDLPAIFLATTAAMPHRAAWREVTGYLYKPLAPDQIVSAVHAGRRAPASTTPPRF
jgi:DNA-binding response OmpR family regulator